MVVRAYRYDVEPADLFSRSWNPRTRIRWRSLVTLKPNNEKKLQDFSFQQYHRPNDPTVEIPSGLAKPWPIRENGTWDLSEEEPTLTRPSLRRRRTVLTACVIAFTIGSLLIIFSSPHSKEFLVPGPLHSSHAQLLAGQGADRCAACHSAGATSSTFGWIAHAFSGASDEHTQSQLCLLYTSPSPRDATLSRMPSSA